MLATPTQATESLRPPSLLHQPLQNAMPFYLALVDEIDGSLKNGHPEKQFRVEVGAEVRFNMMRGGIVSREPLLLVNQVKKPQRSSLLYDDQLINGGGILHEEAPEYTATQPREIKKHRPVQENLLLAAQQEFGRQFEEEEDIKLGNDEEIQKQRRSYDGAVLDKEYLEVLYPKQEAINLEWTVEFAHPGSFFIQFEYFDTKLQLRNYTTPFYINVEPVLLVRDSKLRPKELSILTVISRCLGPLETSWEGIYNNASQLGYNAIHFAPIQVYGQSRSHYSIADQTNIDPYYFSDVNGGVADKQERLTRLRHKVGYLKEEYGMIGIIDIVLNHTAYNSEWLLQHPSAAYNTKDCPHLASAYALDWALARLSVDFMERKLPECPSAPYVNNEGDIKAVMTAIQNRVFNKLNLQEYFVVDIDKIINQIRAYISQSTPSQINAYKTHFDRLGWFSLDKYQLLNNSFVINRGCERFNTSLNIQAAGAYFYLISDRNLDRAIATLKSLLTRLNTDWVQRVFDFQKEALSNMEGEIRWFKLSEGKKQISWENMLVKRYFMELNNSEKSQVAFNGWIMNAQPQEDFAMTGWHYLRRTINIWGDSVKLRYGNCPSDSPYLWKHMSEYVSTMAQTFDGFRLDNAHSTPIHVCQYLLQVARSANPHLFVMAELFTSSAEADALFVKKLNINGLIREMQNSYDAKSLGDYYHAITCREAVVGLVDEEFEEISTGRKYKVLKAKRPMDILYDCTHDNPAPVKKFKTGRIALPQIGVASMADIPIASTWGFDQLLPYNICVVAEKRLYGKPDQSNLGNVLGIQLKCAGAASQFEGSTLLPGQHVEIHNFRQLQLSAIAALPYNKDLVKTNELRFWDIVSNLSNSPLSISKQSQQIEEDQWFHEEVIPAEFQHEFIFESNSAKNVKLAGQFTGWQPLNDLTKNGNKWQTTLTLPFQDGVEKYEFKFVVDGNNWLINPNLPQTRDKSGNINNYIEVPKRPGAASHIQSPIQSSQSYTFNDIRLARKLLNKIHLECTKQNAEIFLHQQAQDVLVILRQLSLDYSPGFDAYVSITRHPYFLEQPGEYKIDTIVELPGLFVDIVFCGYLEIDGEQDYRACDTQQGFINSANAKLKVFKDLGQFCRIEKAEIGRDRLVFFKMPPSFTLVIKTKSPTVQKESVKFLNHLSQKVSSHDLADQLFPRDISLLAAFNHLLYRCEPEEREISDGKRGPYGLEKTGQFKYAGLASFMHILKELKISGDMGHELFDNMRKGNWYIDYAIDRLNYFKPELDLTIEFLRETFSHVKRLSSPLRPKYGSRVIEKLYRALIFHLTQVQMSNSELVVNNSDDLFLQNLILSTLQFYGRVPSAMFYNHKDTMAAGLPHFSTGYTRCWGRDTFIALKGLLIDTGRWEEARDVIVQFARVLRHGGLIPNLHDRGNNTRFNARDAPWFFLQAIKDFYNEIKQKKGAVEANEYLLQQEVELHFRDQYDQGKHREKSSQQGQKVRLVEIVQMIIQAHAHGIKFREWNAGSQIDSQMKTEGFNVEIRLDTQTGFIFGGNQSNCGTWMDKMGSSDKTGNKGIPATPRDGAPIELVAMLYSSLAFLEELSADGVIGKGEVEVQNGQVWKYGEWAEKVKSNFEKHFWIPVDLRLDGDFVIDKRLVNRRGIYKDVLNPSQPYTAYQLRPNLLVAMAHAPELFSTQNAQICLKLVEEVLMEPGCMGIKTLDPTDRNYRGDYVNSDDSCGWNYHQGPEWVWPVGYMLKAKIIFNRYSFKTDLLEDIMRHLRPHQMHIQQDEWEGLPELTNSHGKPCPDSCATQAWSVATILDALRDLTEYQE